MKHVYSECEKKKKKEKNGKKTVLTRLWDGGVVLVEEPPPGGDVDRHAVAGTAPRHRDEQVHNLLHVELAEVLLQNRKIE